MQLPSTFNLFDIFARLIPGNLLIAFVYPMFIRPNDKKTYGEVVILFEYIAVSYAIGTLLYCISKELVTSLINKIAFGDNPRNVYCNRLKDKKYKLNVIKDKQTRKLARKIVGHNKQYYYFGIMMNTLEIKGMNEKEDRMEGGASMSSAMCLTSGIICVLYLIRKKLLIDSSLQDKLQFGILLITTFLFAISYVHYTRMRYSIVVRTYAILENKI